MFALIQVKLFLMFCLPIKNQPNHSYGFSFADDALISRVLQTEFDQIRMLRKASLLTLLRGITYISFIYSLLAGAADVNQTIAMPAGTFYPSLFNANITNIEHGLIILTKALSDQTAELIILFYSSNRIYGDIYFRTESTLENGSVFSEQVNVMLDENPRGTGQAGLEEPSDGHVAAVVSIGHLYHPHTVILGPSGILLNNAWMVADENVPQNYSC